MLVSGTADLLLPAAAGPFLCCPMIHPAAGDEEQAVRTMRRIRKKTTYDKAREILSRAEWGVLSTTCDDGLPYGVPLSFVLTGNAVYFHCATEGQKLDNLMHDRRVCLTAVNAPKVLPETLSMAYESVMAFGEARIVYGEAERQAALRLLCEKYAPDRPAEGVDAYLKAHGKNTVVVRMDVEYISGKASR